MSDNSKKVSELPIAANTAATDRIVILRDPSGTPSLRTIKVSDFGANLVFSNSIPVSSVSNGIAGTIRFDSNYIYVCVSTNTWKRSELSSW